MQYHLVLTEKCNLSCSYCGGTRHIPGLPIYPEYSFEDLKDFIAQDPEPVIGFYGGEPLLNLDLMYKVLDNIPARAYNLQTNATHLSEVKDRYLKKIDTILVSIDGDKETTDRCRGEGTYDTIIGNLRDVQDREYGGDVVARMAYSINGDIYQDVKYLLELRYPEFEHVHWQLDVFWNSLEKWDDFEYWMRRYEKGISLLVKDWVRGLETGEVTGIVPFIPVTKTLLTGEPVRSIRCGAGMNSFAIMTDGNIDACPIAPEMPFYYIGNIYESNPEDLRNSMPLKSPCNLCNYLWVCGGRCLFANRTKFWGDRLFDRICKATIHMIKELERNISHIKCLIDSEIIDECDFDYPEFNNGCEIIP